ncbi:MAG: hypothetical protein AB7V13_20985 [Pseudorhodoplanes sp.]
MTPVAHFVIYSENGQKRVLQALAWSCALLAVGLLKLALDNLEQDGAVRAFAPLLLPILLAAFYATRRTYTLLLSSDRQTITVRCAPIFEPISRVLPMQDTVVPAHQVNFASMKHGVGFSFGGWLHLSDGRDIRFTCDAPRYKTEKTIDTINRTLLSSGQYRMSKDDGSDKGT